VRFVSFMLVAVKDPADVTVKFVKLNRFVPAVVPEMRLSQPLPKLIAVSVPDPAVILLIFNPVREPAPIPFAFMLIP